MRRLILVLTALAFLGACLHRPVEKQVEELDRQIDRSVPPGSSRQELVRFLEARHIDADYLPEKNEVFGKVPGVSRTLLSRTDLALFFVLDSSGRLVSHRIERWMTGS